MLESCQIEEELMTFLSRQTLEGQTITPQTDLLDEQILDSMLMMDLILHVEKTYGVYLDVTDLSPRHFRTVAVLAALIREKIDGNQVIPEQPAEVPIPPAVDVAR